LEQARNLATIRQCKLYYCLLFVLFSLSLLPTHFFVAVPGVFSIGVVLLFLEVSKDFIREMCARNALLLDDKTDAFVVIIGVLTLAMDVYVIMKYLKLM
jgi:hypothetical protein